MMDEERGGVNRKTQDQAVKMLEMSKRRYGEVDVGSTVLLTIPDVNFPIKNVLFSKSLMAECISWGASLVCWRQYTAGTSSLPP